MNDELQNRALIVRPEHGLTVEASALAARGLAALEGRPSLVPQKRWLRFPETQSVGWVKFFEDQEAVDPVGEGVHARGEISVPARMVARLIVWSTVEDFSFLATCDPQTVLTTLAVCENFTDTGLQYLAHLTALRILILDSTQITDAGLRHLSPLVSLGVLSLNDTQITDAGLRHLEPLTKLRLLGLTGTRVTPIGRGRLLAVFPRNDLWFE